MTATGAAFDAVAAEYDAAFTNRPLARMLREAVWAQLGEAFRPGDRVLELGCGTGEDAVWLAGRGVRVRATDTSPAMLEAARRKIEAAAVGDRVGLSALDARAPDAPPDPAEIPYDGAFSDFGALNCLPDRRALARALGGWIRPGGRVVLVVMGPFCPWEIAWYALRGHPRTALRRFRRGLPARLADGAAVRVWYPTPRRLRREFGDTFRVVEARGIGAFLPPPYLERTFERRSRALEALARLDRRWGGSFPWTWLNDHYLLVLERR